jgi:uncharacterized secreted protein with C-terminal beta-propeller domain
MSDQRDQLNRELEARAARGTPRGSDAVLAAARSPRQPRATHNRLVGVAAVVAALAVAAGGIAVLSGDTDDAERAEPGDRPPRDVTLDEPVNASSLVSVGDCDALLDELRDEAIERVGPYGLPGVSLGGFELLTAFSADAPTSERLAPVGPPPSSDTNTQEPGVDEPDIVETDGERLYVVRDRTLRVVDVASAQVVQSLDLGLADVVGSVLVDGSLVVFGGSGSGAVPPRVFDTSFELAPGSAEIVVVDVAGEAAVRQRLTTEASYVDARVVDGRVHVVLASAPTLRRAFPQDGTPAGELLAIADNRRLIAASGLRDWFPSWRVIDASGRAMHDEDQLAPCESIRQPQEFSGFEQTTLLTLDLADLSRSSATAVVAGSLLTYASDRSVYTATAKWREPSEESGQVPIGAPPIDPAATDVHRFALDRDAVYAASGSVEGTVGSQFGMSEHDGHLRVASTTTNPAGFGAPADTRVTVLEEREGALVAVGELAGLGPGERVEGVRFVGDLGYVVTFRVVDPLYVIDLREPRTPRLAGELQIPGFSAYLHPVDGTLLIGVGKDGTPQGQLAGAAVSLFDVSDATRPRRVALEGFGRSSATPVNEDHHAFTWLAEERRAFVPINLTFGITIVQVLDVEKGALVPRGRIEAPGAELPIFDRTVVVGDRVVAVSPRGVQINARETLTPIAWVPFAVS